MVAVSEPLSAKTCTQRSKPVDTVFCGAAFDPLEQVEGVVFGDLNLACCAQADVDRLVEAVGPACPCLAVAEHDHFEPCVSVNPAGKRPVDSPGLGCFVQVQHEPAVPHLQPISFQHDSTVVGVDSDMSP